MADAGSRMMRRGVRRARRDARGGVTVEFALWLPALVGMVMTVADISVVFTTDANMEHAAREAARGLARSRITADEATAFVRQRLSLGSGSDYAVVVGDGPEVSVEISIPTSAASIFGMYELLMPGELVARASMRREDPA